MRKSILLLALTALSLPAQAFVLNPGSLPSAQGWIYGSSGSLSESQAFSADGQLHQHTMGQGLGGGTNIYALNDVVTDLSRSQFSFTARLTAYESNPNNRFGFSFLVGDGVNFMSVGIGTNGIESNSGLLLQGVDTTQWHTYDFYGRPGNQWELWVDGVQRLTGANQAGGTNRVIFGDGTGGANANVDISALSFFVPEPSLKSLLQSL